MRWLSLLSVLLVNAVPLNGVLRLGWSAVMVVAMYWVENALGVVYTAARIALHRSLTRKRGHWRSGQLDAQVNWHWKQGSLLRDYLKRAPLSTFLQGIFVAVFVAFAIRVLTAQQQHPDWEPYQRLSVAQFVHGAESMALAMTVGFALDALSMRQRSFAWIKRNVVGQQGRVVLLHFAMIVGIMAMIFTQSPVAVVYVLIALKTASDLYQWSLDARVDGVLAEPTPSVLQPPKVGTGESTSKDKLVVQRERETQAMIRAAEEDEEVYPP
jgi:hypothetical protein